MRITITAAAIASIALAAMSQVAKAQACVTDGGLCTEQLVVEPVNAEPLNAEPEAVVQNAPQTMTPAASPLQIANNSTARDSDTAVRPGKKAKRHASRRHARAKSARPAADTLTERDKKPAPSRAASSEPEAAAPIAESDKPNEDMPVIVNTETTMPTNIEADTPSIDTPAASATSPEPTTDAISVKMVAANELNEVDLMAPPASSTHKPMMALAMFQAVNDAPWRDASFVGKIFIGLGLLLTAASAIRLVTA